MLGSLFAKKFIGVDIGSQTVKVAEVSVSGKKAVLQKFGTGPVAEKVVQGGEIHSVDELGQSVSNTFNNLKIKNKNVCVGMFGGAVIVKKISMPQMDEKVVGEHIKWEAEQYIPFDLNEVSLDYHILKNQGQESESMNVLLVAAKHEYIFQYVETLAIAKLDCKIIDINGFALANCFEFNYGNSIQDTVALVNIGSSITNLVILNRGEVVFSRDIPTGGVLYDNEIARDMGVSVTEAETLKLGLSHQQESPKELIQVVNTTNEIVAEEINNSFDFYKASFNGGDIARIFISGGASLTPGLFDKINEVTQKPVEAFDPFQNVKPSKNFSESDIEKIKPFAAIAVGLGLRRKP